MVLVNFAPVWAGPWRLTGAACGAIGVVSALATARGIPDVWGATDMVFDESPFHLARYWILSETTALVLVALAVVGATGMIVGGRLFRAGMLLWLAATWILLAGEALNIKAHDRLLVWIAAAFLISPVHEPGLSQKWRSPVARWFLLIVFAGMYGSTGWLKLLYEPGWLRGDVLALHLVHPTFGNGELAVWVSGQPWLVRPMGWVTVLFETSFPFLIWLRRTNPWCLLLGVGLHLGIAMLMDVGKFSWVCLACYPVLLHPEVAKGQWRKFQAWRIRSNSSRTVVVV